MARKYDDPWVRVFDVTEPTRHRKGYTMYKVISKVFPKNSVEAVTKVIVWKRYNDFKKLHKALHSIHQGLHLKGNFPPFAKARFFGRFDSDVIEERRKSALQLLEFAAQYPPLFTSQVFVKFLEGGQRIDPQAEEKSSTLVEPLVSTKVSPKPLRSSPYASDDTKDAADSSSLLGGIWQHRQAADDISLSSHATDDEDDDRTTFTDDDSALGTPLPSIDVSMFDPLQEKQVSIESLSAVKENEECTKRWLLSAIQSCTHNDEDEELEQDSTIQNMAFPKPFLDADECDSAQASITDEETLCVKRLDERESCSSRHASSSPSFLKQFDPLTSGEQQQPSPSSSTNWQADECFEATLLSPLSPLTPVKPFHLSDKQNYLVEAANIISQAQDCEVSCKFMLAFSYYKAAIGILLQGVQGDMDAKQREAVRRKTAQYLIRAENIYEKHLAEKVQDDKRWAEDSRLSPTSTLGTKVISLRGPVDELAKYKVLGVIGKAILVLDTTINETFVIKTLYKSPNPKPSSVPNIVPQAVPYMVKLYRVYETNYALFLVLQHATGGCLWDYVSSYLQRSPLLPCLDCAFLFSENQKDSVQTAGGNESPNVYSGKKLSTNSSNILSHDEGDSDTLKCSKSFTERIAYSSSSSQSSVDSDLKPAPQCPSSYTALFTKYAASAGSEPLVSLAKCNLVHHKVSDDDSDSVEFIKGEMSDNTSEGQQGISNINTHVITALNIEKTLPSSNKELLNTVDNSNISSINKIINNASFIQNTDSNVEALGVSLLTSFNEQQQNIPPEDSGVEQLISNSKALLKNVEQTLRDTLFVSPEDAETLEFTMEKAVENLPDFEVKESSHELIQRIMSNVPTASTTQSGHLSHEDLFPNLKEGAYKGDRKSSRHFHQAESRLCLSSSTGSLERASSRVRNFSEVFKQLDVAAAQTSIAPVHLPESCVRIWMAELVVALSELHHMGIIWQDIRPDNVLLGDRGHILLTYHSQWNCVDHIVSDQAKENLYAAPETGGIFPVTASCDWWSLGAFLFELLTGRTLESCHPGGITSHTSLNIPAHTSPEAQDLLKKLLRFSASERLGSGPHGVEDIKSHPFFHGVNWNVL